MAAKALACPFGCTGGGTDDEPFCAGGPIGLVCRDGWDIIGVVIGFSLELGVVSLDAGALAEGGEPVGEVRNEVIPEVDVASGSSLTVSRAVRWLRRELGFVCMREWRVSSSLRLNRFEQPGKEQT